MLMVMLSVFSLIGLSLLAYVIYSRSTKQISGSTPHVVETYEDGLSEESSSSTQLSLFDKEYLIATLNSGKGLHLKPCHICRARGKASFGCCSDPKPKSTEHSSMKALILSSVTVILLLSIVLFLS